jgi:hypothetical protein
MKKIVCDSSSLISLTDNCLLFVLRELHGVEYYIPKGVEQEIVAYPMRTKRFELPAIRLKQLITDGTVSVYDHPSIYEYSKRVADLANRLFSYKKKFVKIIHEGEAQSLGCMNALGSNVLLTDERTVRHLIENPEQLKQYMESRTRYKLHMDEPVLRQISKEMRGFEVIRSSELVAYAYDRGLLERFGSPKILDAALWGLKFSGCSITGDEIKEYLNLLS